MSTPNAELAYKVLDYIEAHPEQHDQTYWMMPSHDWDLELAQLPKGSFVVTAETAAEHCGTVGCFAGWTVLLAGKKTDRWGSPEGGGRVPHVAQKLLGLTDEQVGRLFWATETLDEVREAVIGIFGPRPERVTA